MIMWLQKNTTITTKNNSLDFKDKWIMKERMDKKQLNKRKKPDKWINKYINK